MYDFLIVGAGFAGCVLAERLTSQLGKTVLLIDRRPHLGGNAYDEVNGAGHLIHRYGPHIFHTNSAEIFGYLSAFTAWRPYEHRVLADLGKDKQVPIPINRTTLNQVFGLSLTTDDAAEVFLAARREPMPNILTSEDAVVAAVGRELYELFFRGYTQKQWGCDPRQLDASVTSRVPTRTNDDDRYFTDRFQAMPVRGYTEMFKAMINQPGLEVRLNTDFSEVAHHAYDRLIYTGPIDAFFDYRFGPLPYRSLCFDHQTLSKAWRQSVGTINYPSPDVPYTRITEYKHITGQTSDSTSITIEYPVEEGDPYYPIPNPVSGARFKRYEALAREQAGVIFVGRLATYKYLNMDQVIGQALAAYRRLARIETAR